MKCPTCNGTGYCIDMPCPECAATGFRRLLDLVAELNIEIDKLTKCWCHNLPPHHPDWMKGMCGNCYDEWALAWNGGEEE